MTYKIAVASSDGQTVNQHFGSASFLKIYAVEGLDYQFLEDRRVESEESEGVAVQVVALVAMVAAVLLELIHSQ